MKRKSRKPVGAPIGPRLIESMREVAEALESGDSLETRFTVRTVEVTEPGTYTPEQIRRLRRVIGASQAIFSQMLGVSPELVQHWEQGIASPRPIARRLLDEISRDPIGYANRSMKRTRLSA